MIELLIEPDPTYWQVVLIGSVVGLGVLILAVLFSWWYQQHGWFVVSIVFGYLLFLTCLFFYTASIQNGERETAIKKALPGELLGDDFLTPPFLIKTPTGVEKWSLDVEKKYLILIEKY